MSSNLPGGSTEPTVSTTGSGVWNNQQNPFMRRSPTIPVWVGYWMDKVIICIWMYWAYLAKGRQKGDQTLQLSHGGCPHLSHLLGSWPSALVGDQPQRDQLLCGPPAVGQWKPGDFLQHMQISHKFSDLLQRCLGVSRAPILFWAGRGDDKRLLVWATGPRLCPSAVSVQSDRPDEARPWLNGISDIHLIINSQAGALAIFFQMSMFSCCMFEDCNVAACFCRWSCQ